jgi:UTP:GlnB (protein PII) uridylyltransferase
MTQIALLPIIEAKEVTAFLQRVPVAVDRGRFADFVIGFPHKYLAATTATEVLKHYMLMECLRDKPVISSLSREGALVKLSLVTGDRRALFSRLAGALSSFDMDIVNAEAFANASGFVLDTFLFADPRGRFADDTERRRFQVVLEEVVEGKLDLATGLLPRLVPVRAALREQPLQIDFDGAALPDATLVTVSGANHFGLLFLVSGSFAEGGYNIELAYVETPEGRVRDQFYLTKDGGKLTPPMQDDLRARIGRLGDA